MIPLVAVVSLRGRKSRTFRIWVPLILLSGVVGDRASGGVVFAADFCRLPGMPHNPFGAFAVGWQILRALSENRS